VSATGYHINQSGDTCPSCLRLRKDRRKTSSFELMGTISALVFASFAVLVLAGLVLGVRSIISSWKAMGAAAAAGLPAPFAFEIVGVTSDGVLRSQTKVFPAGPAPRQVFAAFPTAAAVAAVTPGLAELQVQDPAFKPTDFLSRAVAVVTAVRDAQRQGHPDEASGVMSDRLYNRWKHLAAASAPDPTYALRGFWIAEARSGEAGDTVAVRMQEKLLLETTTTYWLFVRSRAAQTTPSASGAICPNCGAPVPRETGTCPFCHAAMFRSRAEWVLDDIVPAAQWMGRGAGGTDDAVGPPKAA
jgi:hypothetical protein